jgi:hypothetical protein
MAEPRNQRRCSCLSTQGWCRLLQQQHSKQAVLHEQEHAGAPWHAHTQELNHSIYQGVTWHLAVSDAQVIGVKLTGKLSKWTSPKDVILKVGRHPTTTASMPAAAGTEDSSKQGRAHMRGPAGGLMAHKLTNMHINACTGHASAAVGPQQPELHPGHPVAIFLRHRVPAVFCTVSMSHTGGGYPDCQGWHRRHCGVLWPWRGQPVSHWHGHHLQHGEAIHAVYKRVQVSGNRAS